MTEKTSPQQYPFWVRITLLGLPTRAAASLSLWTSVAIAMICAVLGLYRPLFFLGCALFLAALGYWLAIRWVDRHGQWSPPKTG